MLDNTNSPVDNPAVTQLGLIDLGSLSAFKDAVRVVGGGQDSTLNVSNAVETADTLGTLTQTHLTGLGLSPAGIEYGALTALNIDLGFGNDLFNVRGTKAVTTVRAGVGDDMVYVSSGADLGKLMAGPSQYNPPAGGADLADLHATILHPLGSSLDDLAGDLNVEAGPGRNTLSVSDKYSTGADTNVVITNDAITGLAEGNIHYVADGGDFSGQGYWPLTMDMGLFGRGVNIYDGEGGNTIAVHSINDTPLTTPFGKNVSSLFTGSAGDTVTVDVADTPDAMLVIRGEGGDDIVDASASSLPMLIFGDAGGDTITGGTNNDVLIGDYGRAYFLLPAVQQGGATVAAPTAAYDVFFGGAFDANELAGADAAYLTPDLIETTDPSLGGQDTINGGPGRDIILGGADADTLSGGAGDDVILGDNGRFDFALTSDTIEGRPDITSVTFDTTPGVLDRVTTTDPAEGGDDTIFGDGGNDVAIGGAGGDTISGDTSDTPAATDGSDILLGDFAKFYPGELWSQNYYAIDTGPDNAAGADTICGQRRRRLHHGPAGRRHAQWRRGRGRHHRREQRDRSGRRE